MCFLVNIVAYKYLHVIDSPHFSTSCLITHLLSSCYNLRLSLLLYTDSSVHGSIVPPAPLFSFFSAAKCHSSGRDSTAPAPSTCRNPPPTIPPRRGPLPLPQPPRRRRGSRCLISRRPKQRWPLLFLRRRLGRAPPGAVKWGSESFSKSVSFAGGVLPETATSSCIGRYMFSISLIMFSPTFFPFTELSDFSDLKENHSKFKLIIINL